MHNFSGDRLLKASLILIATQISAFNRFIGKSVSWCSLFLVVLVFVIAVLRYAFKIGSIPMQELVIYLHALIFMAGASYTLADDKHVRVDVIYAKLSKEKKAWINLAGTILFLFPVAAFILIASVDYVALSWRINESSAEAGGLPYLFLLKSLILIMPGLLILQGLANVMNSLVTIMEGNESRD